MASNIQIYRKCCVNTMSVVVGLLVWPQEFEVWVFVSVVEPFIFHIRYYLIQYYLQYQQFVAKFLLTTFLIVDSSGATVSDRWIFTQLIVLSRALQKWMIDHKKNKHYNWRSRERESELVLRLEHSCYDQIQHGRSSLFFYTCVTMTTQAHWQFIAWSTLNDLHCRWPIC